MYNMNPTSWQGGVRALLKDNDKALANFELHKDELYQAYINGDLVHLVTKERLVSFIGAYKND